MFIHSLLDLDGRVDREMLSYLVQIEEQKPNNERDEQEYCHQEEVYNKTPHCD